MNTVEETWEVATVQKMLVDTSSCAEIASAHTTVTAIVLDVDINMMLIKMNVFVMDAGSQQKNVIHVVQRR